MRKLFTSGAIWIWLNAAWLLTGLFFLGWQPQTIVFVFIFETIIVGLCCMLKMLAHCFWGAQNEAEAKMAVSKNFSEDELSALGKIRMDRIVYQLYNVFVVAMFAVVFLAFIWGQSIFTFLMASGAQPGVFEGPHRVLYNLSVVFSQPDMQAAFAGIALSHLAMLMQQFILTGAYHRTTLHQLFVQPWVRILIQQAVILTGGFIFFSTGNRLTAAAALFVVIKTLLELTIIRRKETRAAHDIREAQLGTATL